MENLMKVVLTVSIDNERASYGFTTALYLLCSFYTKYNLIGYIQQLWKQKGTVVNVADGFGMTPLHHLCAPNLIAST